MTTYIISEGLDFYCFTVSNVSHFRSYDKSTARKILVLKALITQIRSF